MNNPPRILIDINVWVDSYITTHDNHKDSFALVNEALRHGAHLLYGASKLETIFYLVRNETKRDLCTNKGTLTQADAIFAREFAWGCINNMAEIATAVGADQADLWLARKYRAYHPDFEDNVLLAAAHRSEADYVVTWDERLLKNAAAVVRAVTPVTMCAILEQNA